MLITVAMLADWCGVSRQAMGKHDQAGRIVRRKDGSGAEKVDAQASLNALAGYLAEEKRQKGLARLRSLEDEPGSQAAPAATPVQDAAATSAKVIEQEYRAKMARLDYEERVGNLIPRERIATAVQSAVAAFISELELHRKQDADEIAVEMGLDLEASRRLRVLLGKRDRKLRSRYSGKMSTAAMDAAVLAESGRLPSGEPAEGAAAPH